MAETAWLTDFVRRWVQDRRRGNGARPTILTAEILAMLREGVKSPPDEGGVWTTKKVAAVITAEAGA